MSSRQAHRTRVPSTSDSQQHYNKGTIPSVHSSLRRPKDLSLPTSTATATNNSYHFKCTGSIRGNPCPLEQEDDGGFTDEAFTDPTYYEYYDDDHGYQTSPNKYKNNEYSRTDFTYSEDDDSSTDSSHDQQQQQLHHHQRTNNRRNAHQHTNHRAAVPIPPPQVAIEYDTMQKRHNRHSHHQQQNFEPPLLLSQANHQNQRSTSFRGQSSTLDSRRVYPNLNERLPIESFRNMVTDTTGTSLNMTTTATTMMNRRSHHFSRMSSHSLGGANGGVGGGYESPSAAIDGCGGKCQTFENVCYYFLQVAFTMGILIGVSLGIAGWVLRKSAARNLQVLLYIGALLSLVSGLLLGIQCNARKHARLKRRHLVQKNRAHIALDVMLPPGAGTSGRSQVVLQQQQQHMRPLVGNNETAIIRPVVNHGGAQPVNLVQLPSSATVVTTESRRSNDGLVVDDQQGIPWWRRKDIN